MSSPEADGSAEPVKRDLFQKIGDFLYGATIGVLKEYQEKSIDLVKLTTASVYVNSVKTIRLSALYLMAVFLAMAIFAFSVVVLPLAFVALGPWSASTKLISIGVLAVIYVGVPILLLTVFLSEKKWLELTQSEKLVKSLTGK